MAPAQPLNLGRSLVVPSEPGTEPASPLLAASESSASPMPQGFTRMRGLGGASNSARHGSRTMTITPTPAQEVPGILRLRADSGSSEHDQADADDGSARGRRVPRVQWTEDTVDNEGMNKKKSKVCCIFRKQRQFGESDSEESDSSCCSGGDSDSDSDSPNEYERIPKRNRQKGRAGEDGSHESSPGQKAKGSGCCPQHHGRHHPSS